MQTIYEAVGGAESLLRLASAWHIQVLEDEVVSHAFSHGYHPQHTERLAAYWAEALGGPTTYSDQRGHPRLRMRHAPFAVTPTARDHWLTHFRAALDDADLTPEQDAQFWDYVTHAAQFMINTLEDVRPDTA